MYANLMNDYRESLGTLHPALELIPGRDFWGYCFAHKILTFLKETPKDLILFQRISFSWGIKMSAKDS